jgi:hypothetical protein
MKLALLLLPFLMLQDIAFKPKEDFDIKLDYQFRQRPVAEKTAIHFDETVKERDRRTSSSMLPYLIMKVNLLKLADGEVKVKLSNNRDKNMSVKKVEVGSIIPLTLGFTDDVKDRISPHEYYLTFFLADKKESSRIKIVIDEDGTFFVNDEKRGKF